MKTTDSTIDKRDRTALPAARTNDTVTADTSRPPRSRGGSAPTIYDIAKLAGVNASTVSRALSQPGRINSKTEERIRQAAKDLNYRLNPMARALPTGRTNTLGLLLADITNPMIFGIVRGAEHAASASGYTLIIAESQESTEKEATTAERVQPSVDGLILGTTRLNDEQIQTLAATKPLVLINREVEGVPGVLPDISPGIEQALDHLELLGHTRIAYLSGPTNSSMSTSRWNYLLERAPVRGMSIVEIASGIPTLEGGSAALPRILAAGVTAVVAYNDLMAIGLLRAAADYGLDIPGQMSIIGFDDIFGSDFTSPELTTIRTPLALAGERAVRLALELIGAPSGEPAATEDRPLVTELIVRGSTARASTHVVEVSRAKPLLDA